MIRKLNILYFYKKEMRADSLIILRVWESSCKLNARGNQANLFCQTAYHCKQCVRVHRLFCTCGKVHTSWVRGVITRNYCWKHKVSLQTDGAWSTHTHALTHARTHTHSLSLTHTLSHTTTISPKPRSPALLGTTLVRVYFLYFVYWTEWCA